MTDTAIPAQRYVGASVKRSEDPRILTGRGRYVDDVQLPGMLHAAFVRSTIAHANITSVDVDEARALPGVVAVYTGDDIQALLSPGAPPLSMFPGLPAPAFTHPGHRQGPPRRRSDRARRRREPLRRRGRRRAGRGRLRRAPADRSSADRRSIRATADLRERVEQRAARRTGRHPRRRRRRVRHGRRRGRACSISQHRHQNVPMECRGLVADFDAATGQLTVHSANQGVALAKMILAGQLGHDPDKLRILCGDIGGSFGLKIGAAREDIAVAAGVAALGRPVKWIEDRCEHLVASGHAREETMRGRGRVHRRRRHPRPRGGHDVDTGAYPGLGGMIGGLIERMLPGPYKIGAVRFRSRSTVTNKATYVAYRGPWAAEVFTRERMIDIVAKQLGLEPLDVRLRNVVTRDEEPLRMVTGREPRRRHDAGVARAHRRASSTSRRSGGGRRRRGPRVATSASASPPTSRRPRGRTRVGAAA